MSGMNGVFAKRRARLLAMKAIRDNHIPGDKAITCPKCGQDSDRKSVAQNLSVCPKCGYHFPIGAYYRLSTILAPGSFRELFEKLPAADPLSFPGYRAKVEAAQRKTGLTEAAVTATGTIGGVKCVVGVLDSRFLMGSMSAAVGEKITLAIEYATKNRLPLILFAASGGARMQEGILSLMQMAKTSAALARFSEKGLLYISVYRSHHWWRHRQFRLSGRHHPGRARRSDRLCRSPGHPADHRPDAARGIPAGGVPDGPRLCGRGGAAPSDAGHPVPAAAAP